MLKKLKPNKIKLKLFLLYILEIIAIKYWQIMLMVSIKWKEIDDVFNQIMNFHMHCDLVLFKI